MKMLQMIRPAILVVFMLPVAPAPAAAQAVTSPLVGGGEVSIAKNGDEWRVTVIGPRAGLASLCAADDSRVRILHASAAVGEGIYTRSGSGWLLKTKFDFKLRDRRQGGGPTDAERRDYFTATGWVANADHTGARPREFTMRVADGVRFLGIAFLSTAEPMSVSYWPATMDDDCRAEKVAQGYLPQTAVFRPAAWHPLK